MNVGRVLGVVLIIAGLLVFMVGAVVSVTYVKAGGGKAMGLAIAAALSISLAVVGTFLFVRGRREAMAAMAVVQQQKKLLGIVRAQGRVNVADAALELGVNQDRIKVWVYDFVGKGLLTGYVNWGEGDLVSIDAAQMKTDRCPHCSGELGLAGKGVVECPYCGSEIFVWGHEKTTSEFDSVGQGRKPEVTSGAGGTTDMSSKRLDSEVRQFVGSGWPPGARKLARRGASIVVPLFSALLDISWTGDQWDAALEVLRLIDEPILGMFRFFLLPGWPTYADLGRLSRERGQDLAALTGHQLCEADLRALSGRRVGQLRLNSLRLLAFEALADRLLEGKEDWRAGCELLAILYDDRVTRIREGAKAVVQQVKALHRA